MKQNIHILKEKQIMKEEQIKEQYELLNLTRVEAAKNWKLPRKLDWELLQLNASFSAPSRETIILIYDKKIIWQC